MDTVMDNTLAQPQAFEKTAQRFENVHTHQAEAAAEARKAAALATAAADEYEAVAARAKRIAGRVSDLLA